MGKLIAVIFFIGAFVVFAIIKAVFSGVKGAYNAVFDPQSKNKEILNIVSYCSVLVNETMQKCYYGNPKSLPDLIHILTPNVQSTILKHGYIVSEEIAKSIVKQSIVFGGYATEKELENV